jgi:hypothetical protein
VGISAGTSISSSDSTYSSYSTFAVVRATPSLLSVREVLGFLLPRSDGSILGKSLGRELCEGVEGLASWLKPALVEPGLLTWSK